MAMKKPLYTHYRYKDAKGEWRWRVTHRNGNIVAESGEGYKNGGDAMRAFKRMMDAARWDTAYVKEDQHAALS